MIIIFFSIPRRRNDIHQLVGGAFASASSITHLDLSANKVDVVEMYALRDLRRLVNLDLSHNNLVDISNIFGTLNQLQSLSVGHNKIKHIDHNTFPYR